MSAPIDRLQGEVLRTIFLFACDSFQREYYKTPLSISLVYKRWRNIARSTPALWTHIYFDPYGVPCSTDIFQHYLPMSAGLPLFVKIIDAFTDFRGESDTYLRCLATLCSTSARWKAAEIHMVLFNNFERLLDPGDTLAQLESLTLKWPLARPSDGVPPDVFLRAPNLASFTLLAGEFKPESDRDVWTPRALPWGQFQEVTTDLNVLDTLQDLPPSETERTLVIRSPVPEYWKIRSVITLGINSLVLEPGTWPAGLSSFLDCVSIPTLRDLRLVCPDADKAASYLAEHPFANMDGSQSLETWRAALDATVGMAVRSGCALRSFDFSMDGLYYGDVDDRSLAHGLVEIVRASPGLEILRIVEAPPGCGPALLEDELFMLPLTNLKLLELVWEEDREPPESLLAMLDSTVVCSKLSSVVLGVRHGSGDLLQKGVGADVLNCMRRLRERGIESSLW